MLGDDFISYEELCKRFRYCQTTGAIIGKQSNRALGHIDKYGYVQITVSRRRVAAHRVAWCLHYHEWPLFIVDHIDGDRSNNRIDNLRKATPTENAQNRSVSSKKLSDYKGVDFHKHCNKWRARIKTAIGTLHLGHFESEEEAAKAYRTAVPFFFGDFACDR